MMYTIRDVSEKTKDDLNRFADEHNLTIAEALGQLVEFGLAHYEQNRKNPKKYMTTQQAAKSLPEWRP